MIDNVLYKQTCEGLLLHYDDQNEVNQVMQHLHADDCGPHMNDIALAKRIFRQGYYWPTMQTDYIKAVRKCHACEIYGQVHHLPPTELHCLSTPWPFSAWGVDIIGEIRSSSTNDHKFIVVAIDYFSKWVEAESFSNITAKKMAKFLEKHIFARYGLPHHMVTDNRVQFQGETAALLEKCGVEHHGSSPYRPQANGAVEAANKYIKRILAKIVTNYRDRVDKLSFTVWDY